MNPKSTYFIIICCISLNALVAQNPGNVILNPSIIYTWNKISTEFVSINGSGHEGIPPMVESRIYAMVSIAMHDVVNTIQPKYKTYLPFEKGWNTANMDAAIAQSSYTILCHELPSQKNYYDTELISSMSKIPESDSKTQGIKLGNKIAEAILKLRSSDLSDKAQYPVELGIKPGEYRFTTPFDGPPFNTPPSKGFLALPGWGKVKPFAMIHASQFRPIHGPYKLTSKEYTADFNEIKLVGCEQCPGRTPDQTEYAVFWSESSPLGWNRIAIDIATDKKIGIHELARLLAILHISIADSYIASVEAKMVYNFWRPVTAIHLADEDGNAMTGSDPSWKELGFPTVPIPDYPSAHASAGGAAAAVLIRAFKSDKIKFNTTSTTKPGVTRSFASITQAARENSNSRIYFGIHFRQATAEGEAMGMKIGNNISKSLFPLKTSK